MGVTNCSSHFLERKYFNIVANMKKLQNDGLVTEELIANKIILIRAVKAMVDRDLAELYGVSTKRLNEQVKRNRKRFPPDFMFQLTKNEKEEVVAICDHLKNLKFSSNLPFAFTEHGTAMLANILNSDKAISVNIQVVRVFIKMRELVLASKEISCSN